MDIEEAVDKIMDISEKVNRNIAERVSKPGISGSFIAGGMLVGGVAVAYRGTMYLINYVRAEKRFTIS